MKLNALFYSVLMLCFCVNLKAQSSDKAFAETWSTQHPSVKQFSLANFQLLSIEDQKQYKALGCFVYNGDFPTKEEIKAFEAAQIGKNDFTTINAAEPAPIEIKPTVKEEINTKEPQKYSPAAFYIINDKPVTREQYMYHLAEESKKSNPIDKK